MKNVALLRGINVGGHRKVPMEKLCSILTQAGFKEVRSYIQSGNLVFEAGRLDPKQITALIESVIEDCFGFPVDVIVRTEAQWIKYALKNPFPEAAEKRPKILHLGLSKNPCNKNLPKILTGKGTRGEKIKLVGEAIWVDFGTGVGTSKLSPVVFEKAAGSPVTFRNWNTVLKLKEMLST